MHTLLKKAFFFFQIPFLFAFGFAVSYFVCPYLRSTKNVVTSFFPLCFTSLDERVHSLVLRHFSFNFLLFQMGPEALSCGFLLLCVEKQFDSRRLLVFNFFSSFQTP